jgi:single-strand DNA-binding protein
VNRVRLVGVLGAEPEMVGTMMRLRVQTPDGEWHRVAASGPRTSTLTTWLRKGDPVVVEGSLRTFSYEKNGERRYSVVVEATRVLKAYGRTA